MNAVPSTIAATNSVPQATSQPTGLRRTVAALPEPSVAGNPSAKLANNRRIMPSPWV